MRVFAICKKKKRVLHPAESKHRKMLLDNDTPAVIEGPRLLKNAHLHQLRWQAPRSRISRIRLTLEVFARLALVHF